MTDKPYKHEKPLLKYLQDTKGWALIRDMFPLIGLNAHNVFPKELVPGLVSITKYISIIILLKDLNDLIYYTFKNFFGYDRERHFRIGVQNLLLHSTQVYLSFISYLALSWPNNIVQSIFSTQSVSKLATMSSNGTKLIQAGIMIMFNHSKRLIQDTFKEFDKGLVENAYIFAFLLIIGCNVLAISKATAILLRPIAAVCLIISSFMVLEIMHKMINPHKHSNLVDQCLQAMNLTSWAAIVFLSKNTILPSKNPLINKLCNTNYGRFAFGLYTCFNGIICQEFCTKETDSNSLSSNTYTSKTTANKSSYRAHAHAHASEQNKLKR